MTLAKLPIVVAFDLDDTLYKETNYVRSGFSAVLRQCQALGLIPTDATFEGMLLNGDFIGEICNRFSLPESMRQSLIWIYRLHEPAIALDVGAGKALAWATANAGAVAVVSDGRSVTQRLKLRALGLSHVTAYISEEHGANKPDPRMFEKIMARWPDYDYFYVADNPAKDFIAPNALGWTTVGLLCDGRNVHPQDIQGVGAAAPSMWISDLAKLSTALCDCFCKSSEM